jgi:signal transduction histidine kinase
MRSLDELRALTQGAQAEMRSLLLEMRPGEVADRKMGELMRQLTEAMMARTHMSISLTTAGNCLPPVNVQIALYRITQEALNNIYKHAQAGRAWVNLRCSPEGVTVRVTDDGRGINTTTGPVHQMGLKIMHERAAAIGANLTIRNREEQGTEVMVDWQATG